MGLKVFPYQYFGRVWGELVLILHSIFGRNFQWSHSFLEFLCWKIFVGWVNLLVHFWSVQIFLGLNWWLRWQTIFLQCGRLGFNPGSGIFPGEGTGNPLQYSCLEKPMYWGAWKTSGSIYSWFSLGRLYVLKMYPFILGYVICWCIIAPSLYDSIYFCGNSCTVSSFVVNFESFLFFFSLVKVLQILFILSKNLFLILFLLSIFFSVMYFILSITGPYHSSFYLQLIFFFF